MYCRRGSLSPENIMIAVMTGTEYAHEEKKKSQLMVLFLHAGVLVFVSFCFAGKLECGCIGLRRRDTPSSDTLTWLFCGLRFSSAFN